MTKEKNPESFYLGIYRWVYSKKPLICVLRAVSVFSVIFTAASFLAALVFAFLSSYLLCLELIVLTGAPFLTLSIFRRLFNAKRPYEMFDLSELDFPIARMKKGKSFPSRHVFSAFLVGTVLLPYSLPVGVLIFVFGTLLAIARVLLGIHFIRDVVAGALVGALSALIALFILAYV